MNRLTVLLCATLFACSNPSSSTPSPPPQCGFDGELLEDGAHQWCRYDKVTGAVQENGFDCPPDLQYFFDAGDAFVCSNEESGQEGWTPSEIPEPTPAPTDPDLDVLLVVDNSASMCQEQAALADALSAFVATLVDFDYRIAAVTTDMLTSPASGGSGVFANRLTAEFPFACAEVETVYCERGSTTCEETLGEGWSCDAPDTVSLITNCNDSLNSKCRLKCTTDADCDGGLVSEEQGAACADDPASCQYKCLIPSGDAENSGCVLRPQTQGCPNPADRPAVVTPENAAELLPCLAIVGAEQHNNANLEQGLGAAVAALDPEGANAAQAQEFRRATADLLIVYISDEDDCTVAAGQELKKEHYGRCSCQDSEEDGGPLASVKGLADTVKGFAATDTRVFVAAIVGDSMATDPAEITADREAYTASKCDLCSIEENHPLSFNTYICASPTGKADYGARYVEFVQEFGDYGWLSNVCDSDGWDEALVELAHNVANAE